MPFAALYLLAIWFLAGELVLVPLGLLTGMLVLGWVNGRAVRKRAEALALAEERRFNFLFDIIRVSPHQGVLTHPIYSSCLLLTKTTPK